MADAGGTELTGTAEAVTKLRSKNGVPKMGLATIDDYAQKIWNAARKGEVAPVTIARALTGKPDSKASGGTWATRIGALRLYKVVENAPKNTLRLTPLGIALSNNTDEAAHTRALKEAVLGVPAYASVLTRFDGGPLPEESIVASEYEYGYELSREDALTGAKLFIESASYAGLVDADGVVNLGGLVALAPPDADAEEPEETVPEQEAVYHPESPAHAASLPDPVPATETAPPAVIQAPIVFPTREATPGSGSVGVTVKLDLSSWAVEDVLRVLAALGYEGAPGESD